MRRRRFRTDGQIRLNRYSANLENELKEFRRTLPDRKFHSISVGGYDLELTAARDVYVPTDKEKLAALRKTMLNTSVASEMTAEELKQRNNFADMALFAGTVLVMGLGSLAEQYAIKLGISESGGAAPFIIRMPFICQFLISGLLAAILIAFTEGAAKVADLFDPTGWLDHAPLHLVTAVSDVVNLELQAHMDTALLKVISQFKLLLSIAVVRIICKQTVTKTQWFAITGVVMAILAYIVSGMRPPSDTIDDEGPGNPMSLRLIILLTLFALTMVGNALAGLWTEVRMKRRSLSLLTTVGQNRVAGLLIYASILPFELFAQDQWYLFPFQGFHVGTWSMVVSEVLKCWLVIATVKNLSALFKNLAISFAMLVTYLGSCTMLPARFNPPKFTLSQFSSVLAMASLILAYASSRSDAEALYEKETELQQTFNSYVSPEENTALEDGASESLSDTSSLDTTEDDQDSKSDDDSPSVNENRRTSGYAPLSSSSLSPV